MTPVFQRTDRRFFAELVGSSLTHGTQDVYESGLDISTDGTRAQRGAALVKYLSEQTADPDAALIDLLNYLFYDSAGASFRVDGEAYNILKRKVLDPRGVVHGEDGFELPAGDSLSSGADAPVARPTQTAPSEVPVHAAAGLTPTFSAAGPFPEPVPARVGGKQIFVVHGRDSRPVQVVEQFLIYLGLRMMPWSEARQHTGTPQPTTYDIVRAGMAHAAAIVVIFSPDDEARLKQEFWEPGNEERLPQGQPRQNVLLEAGMAFASAPDRTVFVRSAALRSISDISGFNWVTLDGQWDSREDFVKRLADAGAEFSAPSNLVATHAGPFRVG